MSKSDKNWKNKLHQEIEEFLHIETYQNRIEDVRIGTTFTHKNKRYTVTEKTECEGMWRTHVHINKSNCFDIRTPVRFA